MFLLRVGIPTIALSTDTCTFNIKKIVLLSELLMRRATNIARKQLISLGTCIGKFTKSGKFHLHVTVLDLIAPYAKVHTIYGCV